MKQLAWGWPNFRNSLRPFEVLQFPVQESLHSPQLSGGGPLQALGPGFEFQLHQLSHRATARALLSSLPPGSTESRWDLIEPQLTPLFVSFP